MNKELNFVSKIKIELIDKMGSDLNVVNAARVSHAKSHEVFMPEKDIKLINYLAKEDHWSPFAHTCISIRCSVPIFLARQLVKHTVGLSFNEESRRYIDTPVEFYIPESIHCRPANTKQGRGDAHPDYNHIVEIIKSSTKESYNSYNLALTLGVAPEEARMMLPLNAMTNFQWTGSLMAFARVVKQRRAPNAQLVANEFAESLSLILHDIYKESTKALLTLHRSN